MKKLVASLLLTFSAHAGQKTYTVVCQKGARTVVAVQSPYGLGTEWKRGQQREIVRDMDFRLHYVPRGAVCHTITVR